MEYKLLVLDIDGTTIINQAHPISPKVVKALQNAKTKIYISFCTGRALLQLKELINTVGLKDSYHVVEGGTKVLNPKGTYDYIKSISFLDLLHIMKTAGKTPFDYGFCVDGEWVSDINKAKKGNITNVSLNSNNRKQTNEIMKKIESLAGKYHIALGTHITLKDGAHIMLTQKNASKEFGIRYVQKKLKIEKSETIGVGDMLNDLPIFKAVGLKIAMGNAHEDLKRKADYIVPSVYEDGLVEVIEKYV